MIKADAVKLKKKSDCHFRNHDNSLNTSIQRSKDRVDNYKESFIKIVNMFNTDSLQNPRSTPSQKFLQKCVFMHIKDPKVRSTISKNLRDKNTLQKIRLKINQDQIKAKK